MNKPGGTISYTNKLILVKTFFRRLQIIFLFIWINLLLAHFILSDSPFIISRSPFKPSVIISSVETKSKDITTPRKPPTRTVKKIPLEVKYKKLGGQYYNSTIAQYLQAIEKILTQYNLDTDSQFIQTMFYIGWQESHWNPNRVSRFNIKGGHPTGIFQFLPGTFRSVSNGNIFSPEDQIRAFVIMVQRGRIDEFAVVFRCNYPSCMSQQMKKYILSIR